MQCSQVYSIPVAYHDLRQPFVLKDIMHQLDQLDTVVSDVVNRLQFKIGTQTKRLQSINSRISTCQTKVQALTTNKPTTVFSTARYPGPKVLTNLPTLYHDKAYAEAPPLGPEADEDVHFLPAEPMTNAQKSQETADVLDLFTRINPTKETRKVEVNMAEDGLGPLPDYVPSVGSVLLFNSSENPYQHYTSWDNLLGTDYVEEEEAQKELAKAPKTLVDGDELPSVHGLNYDFQPTMGQHSDLSARLPANLPLDNIADYQYAADTAVTTSIAPSLFQDKTLPELPQIADFAAGPTKFEPTALGEKIGDDWGDAPPPPPPQSSLELATPPGIEVENTSTPPPPLPPPPMEDSTDGMPPPPPPPDAALSPDLEPAAAAPPLPPDVMMQEEEEEASAPAGPRASLLDAIRNPGNLVKLRKVKEREALEEREEAKATENKPLSIAEEVRQRMARRQAAISGRQDKMEQKRDRQVLKQPEVISATEVAQPSSLPTLDLSDNESQSDRQSLFGEEGDMLAQLKSIQKKQTATPRAPDPPSSTRSSNAPPGADFEANMAGLDMFQRARSDSLDLSEASDWSDDSN